MRSNIKNWLESAWPNVAVLLLTPAAHSLETNESESVPALPLSFLPLCRLSPVQSLTIVSSTNTPPTLCAERAWAHFFPFIFIPHRRTHYADTITITLTITPSWLACNHLPFPSEFPMSSVRSGRPTGRTFVGGLPSSPRARSAGRNDVRERETERYRERTRESDYHPHRSAPSPAPARGAPTPSVRSHRSMTNMSHTSRGGSSYSSRLDVPDVPPLPLPRRSDESYNSSASGGSYSSVSGSSSSFLDRMKGRGGYGYGSSRTSVEEEPEPQSRDWKERGGWLRQRMADMSEREHGTSIVQNYRPMTDRPGWCSCFIFMSDEAMDGDDSLPGGPSGYGLRLWSRVATAASTLTISVSKAWASNIYAHPGERASFFHALEINEPKYLAFQGHRRAKSRVSRER